MKHILIHGMGQTDISWQQVREKMSITADCPNLYDFMKESADYDALYDAFAGWCNTFDEPLYLCGLSLGGVLALDYAGHFPEKVASLVLIGTPYKIPKLMFGFQNLVFHVMPEKAFKGMGASKDKVISLTGSMKKLDIPAMTQNIACKTLVLCGEKDGTNYKSGKLLHAAIADSRFLEVKGAGHEVNVDNPHELAEILTGFWEAYN